MAIEQRDETCRCSACKCKFNRDYVGGKWINRIFQFDCPGCGVRLGTQTTWPIIPTLEKFYEVLSSNFARTRKPT